MATCTKSEASASITGEWNHRCISVRESAEFPQWDFMKSELSNSPYGQYWPTSKCNIVGWVYRHHETSLPMTIKSHRIRGHSLLGNEPFHHQAWSQYMNDYRNDDSIHVKDSTAHYTCVLNTKHIRIVGISCAGINRSIETTKSRLSQRNCIKSERVSAMRTHT